MPNQTGHDGRHILKQAGLLPRTSRTEERYWVADGPVPGLDYWATATPKFRSDQFGVELKARNLIRMADELEIRFARAGFMRRKDGRSVIFARTLRHGEQGTADPADVRRARDDLDALLPALSVSGTHKSTSGQVNSEGLTPGSLAHFFRTTIPGFVELELPSRDDRGDSRDITL